MKKIYDPNLKMTKKNYLQKVALLEEQKDSLTQEIVQYKAKLEASEQSSSNKATLNKLYDQIKSLERNLQKSYTNVSEKLKLSHEKFKLFANQNEELELDEESTWVFGELHTQQQLTQ